MPIFRHETQKRSEIHGAGWLGKVGSGVWNGRWGEWKRPAMMMMTMKARSIEIGKHPPEVRVYFRLKHQEEKTKVKRRRKASDSQES